MKKKYFIDTEFIEDGKTIDLISIGIVCDDGREYYAISLDFNQAAASDWVMQNVIEQLPPRPSEINFSDPSISPSLKYASLAWRKKELIAENVLMFLSGGMPDSATSQNLDWDDATKDIQFWADYASYDWVAFCQLWGTMMDLPDGLPMYCNDIQQTARQLACTDLPKQQHGLHNALDDARHCYECYKHLNLKTMYAI